MVDKQLQNPPKNQSMDLSNNKINPIIPIDFPNALGLEVWVHRDPKIMAYCNHRDPKIKGLGTDVPYSRQETGTVSCPYVASRCFDPLWVSMNSGETKHGWQQNFTNIYKYMISTRFHSFPVFLGMHEALHPSSLQIPERLGLPVSWIPEIFIGLLVQHAHHHHIRLFQEASKWSDWCTTCEKVPMRHQDTPNVCWKWLQAIPHLLVFSSKS